MDTLYDILLVLHLLGWAVVLGGAVASLRKPVIPRGMLHGILTALVTGVAMVGLASSGLAADEPDNVKIAVKLLIALAVTALVVLGGRRERVEQRHDALPGPGGQDVLPGRPPPPRFRRRHRTLPPERRREGGRGSLPGRGRPPHARSRPAQRVRDS